MPKLKPNKQLKTITIQLKTKQHNNSNAIKLACHYYKKFNDSYSFYLYKYINLIKKKRSEYDIKLLSDNFTIYYMNPKLVQS